MKTGAHEPAPGDHFLVPKEAATILKTNVRTIYNLLKTPMKDGGPPRRRIGRNIIRFPKAKFMAWAEKAED